jgi:5-methylcytosine-specific restriction enzyme A
MDTNAERQVWPARPATRSPFKARVRLMPVSASNVCREAGCGHRCSGRYCDAHLRANGEKQYRRDYDRRRGSKSKRGYGRRWERLRGMVLARDPLCKIMVLCDGMVPSTDADHIIPRSAGGEDAMENLQGACHACHSHKTATEDSNFARAGRNSRGGRGSKSLRTPPARTAQ